MLHRQPQEERRMQPQPFARRLIAKLCRRRAVQHQIRLKLRPRHRSHSMRATRSRRFSRFDSANRPLGIHRIRAAPAAAPSAAADSPCASGKARPPRARRAAQTPPAPAARLARISCAWACSNAASLLEMEAVFPPKLWSRVYSAARLHQVPDSSSLIPGASRSTSLGGVDSVGR